MTQILVHTRRGNFKMYINESKKFYNQFKKRIGDKIEFKKTKFRNDWSRPGWVEYLTREGFAFGIKIGQIRKFRKTYDVILLRYCPLYYHFFNLKLLMPIF